METILQAKENLELINKNIKSYKKSHELRMINLVQKEDTDSTKNQDLLSELDMLTQVKFHFINDYFLHQYN